jgi:hypothetical protein
MDLNTLIMFLLLLSNLLLGQNQALNQKPPINNNQVQQYNQIYQQNNQSNQTNNQNNNNNSNNQQGNNTGDFNVAGGPIYYLRVILEGIEQERATSVPEQRMDGDLYCDDQRREGIRARGVRSYDTTQITLSDDCDRPAVLLNIPHYLSVYVYLTSTSSRNPQDVFFKAGDVDKNNMIDDSDLLEVLFNFGNNWPYSTSSAKRPDVNLDGLVDNIDQQIVLRNFGAYGSVGPANYSLRINSNDLSNNTNTPPQNLNIDIRCTDGRSFNYPNSNYSLGSVINLTDLPYDCNQPQAFISMPHFLSKRTYLQNNNQVNIDLTYGDTNNDNIIDDSDLLNILFAFGQTSDWRNNPRVDLNFNGTVDDNDQEIVLRNFGSRGDNR